MLDRFYLWMVKDIMPPEDPFLRLRRNLQETSRQYQVALEAATASFREFARVVAGSDIVDAD